MSWEKIAIKEKDETIKILKQQIDLLEIRIQELLKK